MYPNSPLTKWSIVSPNILGYNENKTTLMKYNRYDNEIGLPIVLKYI